MTKSSKMSKMCKNMWMRVIYHFYDNEIFDRVFTLPSCANAQDLVRAFMCLNLKSKSDYDDVLRSMNFHLIASNFYDILCKNPNPKYK